MRQSSRPALGKAPQVVADGLADDAHTCRRRLLEVAGDRDRRRKVGPAGRHKPRALHQRRQARGKVADQELRPKLRDVGAAHGFACGLCGCGLRWRQQCSQQHQHQCLDSPVHQRQPGLGECLHVGLSMRAARAAPSSNVPWWQVRRAAVQATVRADPSSSPGPALAATLMPSATLLAAVPDLALLIAQRLRAQDGRLQSISPRAIASSSFSSALVRRRPGPDASPSSMRSRSRFLACSS